MSVAQRVLRSRAVTALTAPHGVDRYLELVNPMWTAHEVRARITDITPEVVGDGIAPVSTITLQPNGAWEGHRAGQYVQVGVEVGEGRRLTRCFTVSSAASGRGDEITLTMRANPEGSVSKYLVEQAQVGEIVHLSQAEGDFTLPDLMPDHVVFITGGSGITPAMSMLRTLQRRTHRGRITFLHYAQTPAHQIFAAELAEAARTGYGTDIHLVYPEAGGRWFTPMELERLVPGFRDVPTWACGPAGLIEKVQAAYDGSDNLQVEYFKPPAVATGEAGGTLNFSQSGVAADNDGTTLLEQAEAAGLTPTYGCRMGICFSCTTRKTEGTVRNVLTGETSSLPDEDIRICVSAADGNCSIEL